MPVLPSWLTDPLWDQFAALLPERPAVDPFHPLGCHRPRISDRIVFDKLLQLLRFGCSYQAIADTTCSATLDLLADLGPLPDDITVHLDAGYDSDKTRTELTARNLHGRIAHKGEKAPIQASKRWHVERTHAWQNAFYRLARCYERRATVINAFFDFADTIITVRNLIRRAWTTHRWGTRPRRRP
ncbi:transposase [Kitasatospora sp. NPDC087861]|uniref:transposase n=1 Tax=Kitasatospora sp. NPDC087861 TaxID=3364070 RepID=UPI0037F8C4ED